MRSEVVGDLTEADLIARIQQRLPPSPEWMLVVTLVGSMKRRHALRRDGARPGDHLYVSGTVGAAGAGLALLREASRRHSAGETAADPHPRVDDSPLTPDTRRLTAAYLRPE